MPQPISYIAAAARRADLFFMEQSPIHETMHRLTKTLGEMEIPFAIAGAMAANAHGHRRTTADVDILIRNADLDRFKDRYRGVGWIDKSKGSKNFRDAVTGVDIVALIVGQYPGDRKPKPIAFPDPKSVIFHANDGIPYLTLTALLELKIASGMTTSHRPRDLDDAIQLIRINSLPQDFATKLNPFVTDKFAELWNAAQIDDEH